MHSFFDGKVSSECMKFMTALIRVNKMSHNNRSFQQILDVVDTNYFINRTHSDHRHHRLSIDSFDYIDYQNG